MAKAIKEGGNMKPGLSYEEREEILGRAFDYLVETGLEKVAIRALGKRMFKSCYSTLYTYFDKKEDCLIEAARYGLKKGTVCFCGLGLLTEEAANANAEGIQKLSVILNCDAGLLTPLVYNLIAIILGYALWDSRDIAEVQLRDLHRMMKDRLWPEDETNLIYRKEENEK